MSAITSPSFPNGAQCDRTEAQVRFSMLQVIQRGAADAVAADPKPLAQSKIDRAMAKAVESLGPFPTFPPRLDMVSKTYLPEPCSHPRERLMHYHTPLCICGWEIGAHKCSALEREIIGECLQ